MEDARHAAGLDDFGNAPFREVAEAENRDEVVMATVPCENGPAGDAARHEMDCDIAHPDGGRENVPAACLIEANPVGAADGGELSGVEVLRERLVPTIDN